LTLTQHTKCPVATVWRSAAGGKGQPTGEKEMARKGVELKRA